MRTLVGLLVVPGVLTTAAAGEAAPLRTLYVATTGNDSGDGSAAAPWRTLQRAASLVRAGDQVIVRPGRYAGFELTTSGTVTNPIVFSADPGVIVDTPNLVRTQDGINLEGASWVVTEGFAVVGMPRTGIRSVLNHHVTIRHNVGDANGRWGILTGFSDDLTTGSTAPRAPATTWWRTTRSCRRPTGAGRSTSRTPAPATGS